MVDCYPPQDPETELPSGSRHCKDRRPILQQVVLMPRSLTLSQLWQAGRSSGVIPSDARPVRCVVRWVDGDLWRSVAIRKVDRGQMELHVWIGVSEFLESLDGLGRMGLDVRCGEIYRPWPTDQAQAAKFWADPVSRALNAVDGPMDILVALQNGGIDRDGCRVGRATPDPQGWMVPALVLAEHMGEYERAEAIRTAILALRGTPVPGTGEDGYASAQGWARRFSKALGKRVSI